MDLNSFKTFVTVAEQGSFSQAAEKLHLTQSAISKRIASLENLLKVKLFDRFDHKVILTEHGQLLLPKAQEIVSQFSQIKDELDHLNSSVSGTLSLGVSYYLEESRLENLLKIFFNKYPAINLDLCFIGSKQAPEAIINHQLDLAIVALPETNPALIAHKPLWDENLLPVVNAEHPLAKLSRVDKKELLDHKVIFIDTVFHKNDLIDAFKIKHVIENYMSTEFFNSAKMLVTLGIGWSLLPSYIITKNMQVLEMPTLNRKRQIGMIYHKQRTLSRAARAFMAEANIV